MTNGNRISIIVCTCNRAAALRQTLDSFGKVKIAPESKAELIIVDNGSTDDTAMVVRSAALRNLEVIYLSESKKGKSNALNIGLARARGDFILFTDDDLNVAEDWVEQMVACMMHNGFDGVTGQITLAPQLIRPWMTEAHRIWLAATLDADSRDWSKELIGANMAVRRSVLERVPGFDLELGPGPEAIGFCEEKLFALQLVEAGFKLGYAPDARVTHCPDVSRLQRAYWLADARRRGRTLAYLSYHWEHEDIRAPYLKGLFYATKLQVRRALQPPPPLESEGCPPWEMSYVSSMELCRQFCLERRRPRNYVRRGLRKLSH